eukprot:TRINITY_DN6347_c0_g1_i2.p1 TRINITY_DN6347_c0_g1~~TRINITY_DN6347_c0_g1_i2.p1  ORF type:complete len:257 (-),score=58.81 TRINITY_DN6347_c0_g1_i2:19-789(-)
MCFFFLMTRRPPRSTLSSSSAASDVYKRQIESSGKRAASRRSAAVPHRSQSDSSNESNCFQCGKPDRLYNCNFCCLAYHRACCTPRASNDPLWKCPECAKEEKTLAARKSPDTVSAAAAAVREAVAQNSKVSAQAGSKSRPASGAKKRKRGGAERESDKGSETCENNSDGLELHDAVCVWAGVGTRRKLQDAVIVNDTVLDSKVEVQFDQTLATKWVESSDVELLEDALAPQSLSCLLYTSPSPRDRTRSRMPSSA